MNKLGFLEVFNGVLQGENTLCALEFDYEFVLMDVFEA